MENFASVGTMEEQHRHIGETILTITIGLITIIISLNVKFSLNICLAVKRYFQLGSEKNFFNNQTHHHQHYHLISIQYHHHELVKNPT